MRNASAILEHETKNGLSTDDTLFCGTPEPFRRFGVALRKAAPLEVNLADKDLGVRVALFGGEAIPLCCFREILENAFAVPVHLPEADLSTTVALVG